MSHRTVATLGALAFLIACALAGWHAGEDRALAGIMKTSQRAEATID